MQVCGLLHDVGPGKIVAALLQHLNQRLCEAVAGDRALVELVAVRKVLGHEGIELLHAGIIVPLRVGGILDIGGRDNVLRILISSRLDHAADRGRHVIEEVQRLPSDLGGFLDRLRGEFRRCDIDEHVGAARLQLDDMAVDGRLGGLIAFFGNDHRCGLGAEPIRETLQIVLAVIVILIEHRDLRVRLLLEDIFGVDLGFALVARLPSHGPGKVLGIVPFGGAGGDEELRHLLRVHVFLDCRVGRRPQRIEDE